MIEFPRGLRMARPGDEERLFAIFCVAHAENGYGDLNVETVREVIAKGCRGDHCVIALVEGPERIEAAVGFTPEKRWYSTDAPGNYYSTELLVYVHPMHRQSRHAVKLLRFAQWWEQETKLPVVLGLMPRDDFEDKERLFERFGRRVGSLFMIGGDEAWPARSGTA